MKVLTVEMVIYTCKYKSDIIVRVVHVKITSTCTCQLNVHIDIKCRISGKDDDENIY